MKQSVLKSLMRLFAIAANISTRSDDPSHARSIVASYLKQLLKNEENSQYLTMFDYHFRNFNKRKHSYTNKKISLFSVKALMICEQINEELLQTQKVLILLQLLEVINEVKVQNDKELDFIKTVAITFKIDITEYLNCKSFVFDQIDNFQQKEKLLIINQKKLPPQKDLKHISIPNFPGEMRFLHVSVTNTYIFKYIGERDQIYINNRLISPGKSYIMDRGAAIRSVKFEPVYYSDIVAKYLEGQIKYKISFIADNISFQYSNSGNGLHNFSFAAESGNLIGIMGGSGVGKSTLINLLNGNIKPTSGQVVINGYNLHEEKHHMGGIIGFVPQDDLLIEELTVLENLYYSSRLCFGNSTKREVIDLVNKILHDFELYDIKDLKVGSVLNKFISGGERKRLNIALELIREPEILFVDEPTTGLSSTDSENVMDLLRELTLKGKLIIVNIHQPSSNIFKSLDKLIVMDKGGYPVYFGNPVEGIIYFKTITGQINASESECNTCGHVEPDEILETIESRQINERGENSKIRRVSPEDWYKLFTKYIKDKLNLNKEKQPLPEGLLNLPGKIKQFSIYFRRNLMTKLSDKQYLLISLLEAPLLALILGYFTKHRVAGNAYLFSENENLPAFLFMSIVVALFIGMMVSSEEIIKDSKILKRESFLKLSRASYLHAKILYLFALSAIQCFMFVLIGNSVLEIKGMGLPFWLILFSTACFANMLGLNISAGLRSVVAIYITIPLLLVPQLLFSGSIIKFDKLHRIVTSESHVPLIGNIMASRWAYEALMVKQYKDNAFFKNFYLVEKKASNAAYALNFYIPALESKLESSFHYLNDSAKTEEIDKGLMIVRNEMQRIAEEMPQFSFPLADQLTPERFNEDIFDQSVGHLEFLRIFYRSRLDEAMMAKDQAIHDFEASLPEGVSFYEYKTKYHNERMESWVLNKQEKNKIVEYKGRLVQKAEPVYLYPESSIGRAQLFSPVKKLGRRYYDTMTYNVGMIWLMSLFMYLSLITDFLKKTINFFQRLKGKTGEKPI
ncbi:MAG: ATP-binding cassette domain-containing protein [Bacteroidales bacterium]|nr:ATP-binding cassette domain-containing protein [Bacteroidales bacterium]